MSLALEARLSSTAVVLSLTVSALGKKESSTYLPVIADLYFVSVQDSGSRTFHSLFPQVEVF